MTTRRTDALLSKLIHPDLRGDGAKALRHKRQVLSNLLAGSLALALVSYQMWYRPPTTAWEVVALAWLCSPLFLAFVPRFCPHLGVAQTLGVVNLAALITYLAVLTGGLKSFLLAWFIVIPAEAAVAGARGLVAAAVVLSASGLALLVGLEAAGLLPVSLVPLDGAPWLYALGAGGAVIYAAGLALTIQSQYAESERQSRDGEERYRLLADHAADLITRHGPDGAIAFASPAALRLLGQPPQNLLGRTPGWLAHPEDRFEVLLAFMRAGFLGEDARVQYRLRRGSGGYVWVETWCRPAPPCRHSGHRGPSRQGREVVAVTRDITPQKAIEAELVAARDAAEAASGAKSRFLANMSHELRTPLNAIIGFSDMMKNELFGPLGGPRYRDYVAHIHDSGRHLLDLINDVLDIAKIEAGKRKLELAPVTLRAVAEDVVAVVRPLADKRKLTLNVVETIKAAAIEADRRALKQMLLNLLSNAIKFTPPGGCITIAIDADAKRAHLAVRDTGVGIPPAALAKLGQPFEQVEGDALRTSQGTGLGLALVKSLAALHGGDFKIESTLGKGTEVTITLPRRRARERPTQAQPIRDEQDGLRGAA